MNELSKDWLYEQYITQRKTVPQICREFDLNRNTVAHKLSKFGIKKTDDKALYKNPDWLYLQYIENDKTQLEIGEMCGVQQSLVGRYLIKYGIEKDNTVFTKDFLYQEHIINHKSMLQIAKETGHNNITVRDYLIKYNIPIWTCHDNTNVYINNGDNTTTVKVYDPYGEYIESFIIDTDLEELVKKYKWVLVKDNIVKNRPRYRVVSGTHPSVILGRYLLDIKDDNIVADHIDNNTLNNLMSNLRPVNRAQNQMNHDIHRNNTSGFTGVTFVKNKWIAQIKHNNISAKLGKYNDKEDAVYARYIGEKLLFKDNRSDRNDDNIFKEIGKCKNKKRINESVKGIIKRRWGI